MLTHGDWLSLGLKGLEKSDGLFSHFSELDMHLCWAKINLLS